MEKGGIQIKIALYIIFVNYNYWNQWRRLKFEHSRFAAKQIKLNIKMWIHLWKDFNLPLRSTTSQAYFPESIYALFWFYICGHHSFEHRLWYEPREIDENRSDQENSLFHLEISKGKLDLILLINKYILNIFSFILSLWNSSLNKIDLIGETREWINLSREHISSLL